MATAFIYMLYSAIGNNRYVGSTKIDVHIRLSQHKSSYKVFNEKGIGKYYSAHDVLKYSDVNIIILKTVLLENKRQEEDNFIQLIDCVNKNRAKRSISQYYKDKKLNFRNYYNTHRDAKLIYQKNYYLLKKQKLLNQ